MSQTEVQLIKDNAVVEADIANDAVTRDKINVVSTSSAPGIEIKGDDGSQEGYLQLNCRVNSHGVKIQSPPHSASQSYKIILPDNQIAADKILKVKSITGSGSTATGQLEFADAAAGGLAMADQWRYTAEFTQSNTNNYLTTTSNWERPDGGLGIDSSPLGTGMTQSGGLFTFPSTGYYLILFTAAAKVNNDSCETFVFIQATENNSSYTDVARALFTIPNQCTPNYGSAATQYLARVTNTSNDKIRFRLSNSGISVTWLGESGENRIAATFLKLGDI